ncbi:MAG: energy transducer TonB [Desulfuromonadales bacterium]|nr:energy transducer TonB [Desulfuromonadales bacterium]
MLVEAHPRYDENPPPAYPRLAEQRGWEGEVLLRVRIAASGKVLEAAIQASSGYPILDRAALTAVRSWRFEPGRRGGLAVESQVLVPVKFQLQRS